MADQSELRVLYVEDWENDAVLVTVALTRAGYAVQSHRATTAPEMQAALAASPWDLVIADHTLPEFDAPRALALLQASGLDIPFIIVSGTMDEQQAVAALRAGAHDFITKASLSRLAPAVARELREAELRRQRRQADAALRETQARLRQVWETASDALAISDANGIVLDANLAYYQLYGYSPEQVLGRSFALIFPEAGRAEAEAAYARVFAGEDAPPPFEAVVCRADGSERVVEARATFIVQDGRRTAMLSSIRDITERKRAEEALADSERRFRALIENSADGVTLISRDGVALYDSPNTARMLGYTPEEMIGRFVFELLHPDDLALSLANFYRVIEQPDGPPITSQLRLQHKDGGWRWIEATGRNLLDEPSVRAIVVNYRDVTERKRAEEALAASERRFRALIENSADAITLIGADGRVVYDSPSAPGMLGYAPDELINHNVFELIHPDEAAANQRLLGELVQKPGSRAGSTFRVRHKDAQWRWIEATASNLLDEPSVNAIVVNYRDVTDRVLAEAALRESEVHTRLILDTALDAVITIDSHSRVTGWNAQAERMFGWPREAALGQALYDLIIPGQHRDAHLRGVEHFLATGEGRVLNRRIEITAMRHDQHEFPVELAIAPVRQGGAQAFSAFVRDITERKAAEHQIRRQLDRLAALQAVGTAINSSLDLRLTLGVLVEQVASQLAVHAVDVLLLDARDQTLVFGAGRGFQSPNFQQARQRLGEGRAGRAALERRMIAESEPGGLSPPSLRTGQLRRDHFVSYYGVPLLAKGQVVGVLELFHRAPLLPDVAWLEFLGALAGQAATAIENASLFEGLQRSHQDILLAYDATIEGWSRALDLRDRETEGHSQRVTELAVRLARVAGMSDEELVQLRRGALLHDIGKMGIPDHILLKPGPLSEVEWEIMRQHPAHARQLLEPIDFLRPALAIPYGHHEKWDGTGYPRGLKGELIPLAARVFAVVDVWDALRSDRPYRRAWPTNEVLSHVRALAGSHFDPRVVETFLQIVS